jgi:hypothetical protein
MSTEDHGTIKFLENAPDYTELFRISRDGIWAHPDVPVDETAQKVIEALDSYIKELVQKAVEAEREQCILILERLHERSGGQYNYYAYAANVLKGEI